MYGEDILCGVSKGTFDIPLKISDLYIERCVVCWEVKIYELVGVFETSISAVKQQICVKLELLSMHVWRSVYDDKPCLVASKMARKKNKSRYEP